MQRAGHFVACYAMSAVCSAETPAGSQMAVLCMRASGPKQPGPRFSDVTVLNMSCWQVSQASEHSSYKCMCAALAECISRQMQSR